MSDFKINSITIAKEDAGGVIPSAPTLLKICFEEFTLKNVVSTDDIACLLKEGTKKIPGKESLEGGAKLRLDAQTMPFVMVHTLGSPDSTVDFTAVAWIADTETTLGTVVNHSDGERSMYATQVYGDTMTGAVEPTGSGRDNNVKWVFVNLLQKQIYKYQPSCPKFTVEYDLYDGSEHFYQQFSGVEIGSLPLNVDGEMSTFEVDLDFKATESINNQQGDWVENLEVIAGAQIVTLDQDYYGGSCETTEIKINDINVTDTESVSMNIDKAIEQKNYLNCEKSNKRTLAVTGELKEDFTIERFNAASEEESFKLDINLGTKVGAYAYFTFNDVSRSITSPDLTAKDDVTLSPEITAEELDPYAIVEVEVVSPILIADDGTVIGSY